VSRSEYLLQLVYKVIDEGEVKDAEQIQKPKNNPRLLGEGATPPPPKGVGEMTRTVKHVNGDGQAWYHRRENGADGFGRGTWVWEAVGKELEK